MPPDVPDYETPRRQLADALVAYMRGEIDNFAFDDASHSAAAVDASLWPITRALWSTYDDLKRHQVRADRQGWQGLRRCVAFLLSDQPVLPRGERSVNDRTLWPFPTWAARRQAAPALATVPLPAHNPAVHGRPIHGRTAIAAIYGLWVVIGLIVVAGAIPVVAALFRL